MCERNKKSGNETRTRNTRGERGQLRLDEGERQRAAQALLRTLGRRRTSIGSALQLRCGTMRSGRTMHAQYYMRVKIVSMTGSGKQAGEQIEYLP